LILAQPSYIEIRDVAQQMEGAAFDAIWLADHLLYRPPGHPSTGIWECWTILSALAEATLRIEARNQYAVLVLPQPCGPGQDGGQP
jgi:alkanesulfonate monooxygenase SsuD/methylene tetrahydromethanopterin reductase-like flavin-dependent oxidoreductase (luciferase family)